MSLAEIPSFSYHKGLLMVALLGASNLGAQVPDLGDPMKIPPMLELPHAKLPEPVISTDMPWPWWYYLVAAIVIFTLLYLLSYFLKSLNHGEPEPPLPALQEAKVALKGLEVETLAVTQLSHELSLIIRRYQSRKFLEPFQCKTMEEIYQQSHSSRFNSVKDLFQPLAQEFENISFSPNADASERKLALVESVLQTLELVERTPIPNPSPEALS